MKDKLRRTTREISRSTKIALRSTGKQLNKAASKHSKTVKTKAKSIYETTSKKIDRVASENQEKIAARLSEGIPDGEKVGRHIEKKLQQSHKVWSNSAMALFSNAALDRMASSPKIARGILMLILTVMVLIFPTDKNALMLESLMTNFIFVTLGIILAQAVTYATMRALGSKTKIKTYFGTVNTALFLSLILITLPVTIVAFAIFSVTVQSDSALRMYLTLAPFYNYLIFGWASESLSRLKGIRSIVVGIVSLLMVLLFSLILPQLI